MRASVSAIFALLFPKNPDPMRSDILKRIQVLLQNEDLEAIRKDVRSAIEDFRAMNHEDIRNQRDAWSAREDRDPEEVFEYTPAPEQEEFDSIVSSFKEREKAWRHKVAEEQRENLAKKEAMLQRLRHTIQEEENIGAAFAAFHAVREEWEQVGDVPGDRYKDIHDTYYRLRDDFFYNINIYKELQDHDLKRNLAAKEALLEQAKLLTQTEDLMEREKIARNLQRQWLDVGPSPRENYKELGDEFFSIVRPIYDAVKEHYDQSREGHAEAAVKKEALSVAMRAFVAEEVENSHPGWTAATAKILEIQKEWKACGFAGREKNETLWTTFRDLADVFFKRKQLFYDQLKEQGKENREKKEALIAAVEAINESTDWKATTDELIRMQKQWKEIGPCSAGEEQRLWRKFRKAQDTFFKAKKAQFADRHVSEAANLNDKQALIDRIEKFELTSDRKADLDQLKAFSSEWNAIGHVPRKNLDEVMSRFRKAMDSKYEALSALRSERSIENYKERVGTMASKDSNSLRREQHILREKIDRLKNRVTKTEENIERFTGKGAEAIRDQYEKSIRSDKREIEEIKEKLRLLRAASQTE